MRQYFPGKVVFTGVMRAPETAIERSADDDRRREPHNNKCPLPPPGDAAL
jgi:hypothetical protein